MNTLIARGAYVSLIALALVTASSCTTVTPQVTKAIKPNIVFILNDDLGWGDVGYHGSEIRTPTLDSLARRGVELNRYYTYAVCSPTRAALMSGRSSLETGVDAPIGVDQVLPMNSKILPQYLKAQGYQTAMVGKWHLGQARSEYLPMSRGFDSFYGFLGGFIDHYTHLTPEGHLDWQRDGSSVRESGYSTDLFTDEAIKKIRGRDKKRPLFLYLAYDAPHTPLQAPEEDIKSYLNITDPIRRTFAAMVQHNDAQIARVLTTLKSEGMLKNTLIVWASDNGPELRGGGTAGILRAGKGTAFEGGQRVPAIVYWEGKIEGGKSLEVPLSVLDWFPTLLDLAGGQRPNDARVVGINMLSTLQGDRSNSATPFIVGNRSQGANGGYYESIYQWPFKLLRSSARNIGSKPLPENSDPAAKISLLFNVDKDPAETNNLVEQYVNLVRDLEARLDAAPRAPRSLSEWGGANTRNRAVGAAPTNGAPNGRPAGGGLAGGAAIGDRLPGGNALQGYSVEKGESVAEAAIKATAAAPL